MDFYTTLMEVIDFRSFSTVWYWMVLAVIWSSASYFVLGVPYDMIQRAKRHGGEAQDDLETLVALKVRRLLLIGEVSGLWVMGFVCFFLTALALLGFVYDLEIAQALFLIFGPLSLVGGMALSTAVRINRGANHGEALHRALARQRLGTQVVGIVAIFVTAMFGMYQNLQLGPL
ncbi:MAG: component of SufBCD complex [Pseudomonadota bacterium]